MQWRVGRLDLKKGPRLRMDWCCPSIRGRGTRERWCVSSFGVGGGGLYNKKDLEGFWTEQGPSAKGMALEPPPSAPSLSPFF